ncbi:MAG: lamin tail domain-containing protein [Bacteroidales bacterium]|jgi:hypothetical protein|nr:lamin tail domain-containing protein [Bacteroidales bacterium]
MKKVLLLFLLIPGMVCAQVVYEDFESGLAGDWLLTGEGRWGTDSVFAINGKYSLHHSFDNSDSGCDRIGTSIVGLRPALSDTEWKFKIRHAYNPSSSNNWSFFLMSDEPPSAFKTGGTISGFALGVNLSGYSDTLCLWKITGGSSTVLLSTSLNWQNDIGVDSVASLSVLRSAGGLWQVFIDNEQGSRVLIGEAYESELFHAGWAGIMYEYSSAQDRKLWVDDIIIDGLIVVDSRPPRIDTAYFADSETLILSFNETLSSIPENGDFILYPGDRVPAGIIQDGNSCLLKYNPRLENKTSYDLHLSGICDISGNCCDTVISNIVLALPELKDIIISEIMFDPEPPAGLPQAEYIELYNNTDFDFNTGGMSMDIGGIEYSLPECQFSAGEYVLFTCPGDAGLFSSYGKVLCPSSNFDLRNTSDIVILRDSHDMLIHGLEYDIGWYSNQLKQYGGWSLEMIDYDYPFAGKINWRESKDNSGGTPGRLNSLCSFNPDMEEPLISNIYPLTAGLIRMDFSESMAQEVLDPSGWTIKDNSVVSVNIADPLLRSIDMEPGDSLRAGVIYEISPGANLSDMAGNSLLNANKRFGLSEETEENDMLFNEIMFDPLPGGAEFIELYNNSEKIVDLADHFMLSYKTETQDTGKMVWLSDKALCLMPGEYIVLCTDREYVISTYSNCDESRIFELASLPSLPDSEGNLLLYNRKLILIDRMSYSEKMHSAMLSVTSGISLERISQDMPATDMGNWRSAAGTAGYATPGIKNSASVSDDKPVGEGSMSLSSRKISPDNDGFEDYLRILVQSGGEQDIISLEVYNDMGYRVRTLADRITSSGEAVLIWDGCDDYGQPVREGIYIIYSSIMHSESPPEHCKKVCAVIYY